MTTGGFTVELLDPSGARGEGGEVLRYAAGRAPGDIGLEGLPPALVARLEAEDEDEAETALAQTTLSLLCGVAWRAGRRRLEIGGADLEAMATVLRLELAMAHLQRVGFTGGYTLVDTADRTNLGAALRLWLEEAAG